MLLNFVTAKVGFFDSQKQLQENYKLQFVLKVYFSTLYNILVSLKQVPLCQIVAQINSNLTIVTPLVYI